jgi:hypothetical protein
MSALTQKLRNASRPGAWSDPKTFLEAAERIEELEAKLLQLTEEKLAQALSAPSTTTVAAAPKRGRGRPPKVESK